MNRDVTLHPHALKSLFAYQGNVKNIFKDVLDLHNINHIAITQIDNNRQLLTFSSTPSLEFNLFDSSLWQFDQTYQAPWYECCGSSFWPSLYMPTHYEELYCIKQAEHQYLIGRSLAVKLIDSYVIYSFATQKSDEATYNFFTHGDETFHKIGEYCLNLLMPIFETS
jgi:hypothetical protein